ncbi:MAG: 23S rRNA (adenine(2503)-C(2))-methyltransferase RlmN [Candidatus Omnitrophica bacterium]|nr:23S rRNA (adenine(2503)-C(2))-methyltransferase RlmN [Candidatus Omnitrophota bacterium]
MVETDIKSLTRDELAARLLAWHQPAYRVDQLLDWLYRNRVADWDAMTNLPKALRNQLSRTYSLRTFELVCRQGSTDSTQKFLWRLADHALIESVLIPASAALYGEPSDRHTLCVSTQVGCAYRCRFCASGLEGWKRNLRPEEIVEQVFAVERWHARENSKFQIPNPGSEIPNPESQIPNPAFQIANPDSSPRLVDNLVIMGMGEPLANYDALIKALQILNAPWGGRIGARKITVSTSGLAPQIRRLANERLQLRLAVSLHGATDEVRNRIMPVNRKYPLAELVSAIEYYVSQKGAMISLEYILIAGINDGLDQVKPLARWARRLHAKVNLIPYNPVDGLPWQRPGEAVQQGFFRALRNCRVPVTLRREKGIDIDAACGQLRLKAERLEDAHAGSMVLGGANPHGG